MRVIISVLIVFFAFNLPAYCQQKIKDFYLSNFKEDGTRDWEVRGEEAVIHEEHVDIDDMKANYYSQDDTIVITSDKAKLNKENMDVALQDNVKVQNKEGVTLSTDSLNWKRDQNKINTDDWVQTSKDAMQVKAKGLSADTEFRKVDFEQKVEATLPDQETGELTTITCSGPLEIEYNEGQAVFNDDVVITHPQGKMFSDKAIVYFDIEAKKIKKIICEGNVKIERGSNVTLAKKATFYADEEKVVLEGRPHLTYYPEAKK